MLHLISDKSKGLQLLKSQYDEHSTGTDSSLNQPCVFALCSEHALKNSGCVNADSRAAIKKFAQVPTSESSEYYAEELRQILPSQSFQYGEHKSLAILNQKDSKVVTMDSIRRLREGKWLNDEVINFYMTMLEDWSKHSDNCRTYIFSTFFMDKLLQNIEDVRMWRSRRRKYCVDVSSATARPHTRRQQPLDFASCIPTTKYDDLLRLSTLRRKRVLQRNDRLLQDAGNDCEGRKHAMAGH